MPAARPTSGSRRLGFELLKLRKAAKLSTRAVGARVGWSATTISRLERGLRKETTSEEVATLLAIYEVTGSVRDQLLALSKLPAGHEEAATQTLNYLNFEKKAKVIFNFEPLLVPGLLQTAAYARLVMTEVGMQTDEAEIDANVAARLGRQAMLSRPKPPKVQIVIAERALRQGLGGVPVMSHQVRHIVDTIEQRPSLSVRVIRDGAVAPTGLLGGFVIMEFADAAPIVFIDARQSTVVLDSPNEVRFHRLSSEKLVEAAQSESGSLTLLAAIGRDLARE